MLCFATKNVAPKKYFLEKAGLFTFLAYIHNRKTREACQERSGKHDDSGTYGGTGRTDAGSLCRIVEKKPGPGRGGGALRYPHLLPKRL